MSKVFNPKKAKKLDSLPRKLFQNPLFILKGLLKPNMTVLDFGAGTGFFSIPMSKKVEKVIAVDLQSEMLNILRKKITSKKINNVKTIICTKDSIGISEKIDFALLMYIVHEVPNQTKFFKELKKYLKGKVLLSEPKHQVSIQEFKKTLEIAKQNGFTIIKKKYIPFSRSVILKS